MQGTLADTAVTEVEALRKLSQLYSSILEVTQTINIRAATINDHTSSNDKAAGRDGAEKSVHRDRSLSRGSDEIVQKRKASQSSTSYSAPARRAVDKPCGYSGCHHPPSHFGDDCHYEESNIKNGVRVVINLLSPIDDGAPTLTSLRVAGIISRGV